MTREEFLIKFLSLANLPYIWGGEGPIGYDCSGLVQYGYGLIGIDPPGDQNADTLMRHFLKSGSNIIALVSKPELGDLVCYGDPKVCTHVAIALNEFQMFEAGGGDHTCVSPEAAARKGAKLRVSAINRRKDLIVIVRPTGLPWGMPIPA